VQSCDAIELVTDRLRCNDVPAAAGSIHCPRMRPADVFIRADRFQVRRINARANATEMIDLLTFQNGSHEPGICGYAWPPREGSRTNATHEALRSLCPGLSLPTSTVSVSGSGSENRSLDGAIPSAFANRVAVSTLGFVRRPHSMCEIVLWSIPDRSASCS